jgi:hypothetical protein
MEIFVEKVLKKAINISERITPGWAILAKRWVVELDWYHFNRHTILKTDV